MLVKKKSTIKHLAQKTKGEHVFEWSQCFCSKPMSMKQMMDIRRNMFCVQHSSTSLLFQRLLWETTLQA